MRLPLLRLRTQALDLLFPPSCGICGAGGSFLCQRCKGRLPVAAPPRCRRCWSPSALTQCAECARTPLDGASAPYIFDGGARTLVHNLKYQGLHALAEPMGELLTVALLELAMPVDVVVPVPLHGWRRRRRGFNQSELLAREISERTGVQVDTRALRRARNTPPQLQADDRVRREANIRDAFRCSQALAGRKVLLVDDVLTTGATARECARTLKSAGAASVWALTFCHAD